MKSEIILADGRCVDLAASVGPALYAELEKTRSPRLHPALRCGGCGGGIYLQHGRVRKDELFGYHHDTGPCTETLVIRKSTMSDEHKREAEYHARAAERAGHVADFEVVTTGHTRVDVVVDGRVGFEIQRSALGRSAAVDRTARSVKAGLGTVAWFTDRSTSPAWTGHVPAYRTLVPVSAWQALPLPGTVIAAGLQVVEAVRCGTRGACLHRQRDCGRLVPAVGAWGGLHVDDVVTGLAEDAIKPVRIGKYVRLMSAGSVALYEELTGCRLQYDVRRPRGQALAPSTRQECGRPPQPEMITPTSLARAPEPISELGLRSETEPRKPCIRCRNSSRLPGAALCARCDEQVNEMVAALRR
ncbi:MAG: hypothetical protein M3Z75_13715 [Actinomycetota bacterium]|nr:hypothetical protein [Actinomycetota bacterium]